MKLLSLVTVALAAVPAVFATQPDIEERSPVLDDRTFGLGLGKLCNILPHLCKKSCTRDDIIRCARLGSSCDENCRCVGGGQIQPPPQQCGDDVVQACYAKGLPCNSACECPEPPPTVVGCQDQFKIKACALKQGVGVDSNCRCITCPCWKQWDCCRRNGKLDANCICILPSNPSRQRRDGTCPVGETMCRVSGGKDGRYECINTQSNLESCGGCASTGTGVDCSAIDGAADVACIAGKCVVGSCLPGYTAVNGNSCVADVAAGPLLFAQN